jgi:4-amino-4-deoxy-L-arabinose transferase-like glycosyltransferase
MQRRLTRWLIVAAFSVCLGQLVWGTFGDPTPPDYFVGGNLVALTNPDAQAKQLYLRRTIYLRERPRHAWLQILSGDSLDVFVNGERLAAKTQEGFAVGIVEDPTPYLRTGKNVIAISTHQMSTDRLPEVAVEGAYWLSDGEHMIGPDDDWQCSPAFERRAGWWFQPEFDDRQWAIPKRQPCTLSAKLDGPPRSTIFRSQAKWITMPANPDRSMAVTRSLNIRGRPSSAWLRVTSDAGYRLAINGVVVDEEEQSLGTTQAAIPVRRSYDVTTFFQSDENVVAMLLTSSTGNPAVVADLEVEDDSDHRDSYGTDEQWQGQPGCPDDWLRPRLNDASLWRPCYAEAGDLGVLPWKPERELVNLSVPFEVALPRLLMRIGIALVIASLAGLVCGLVARCLDSVAYMPLVPVSVAIAIGVLATFDPRVGRQDVYQGRWVALAAAAVVVQWLWLMSMGWIAETRFGRRREHIRPLLGAILTGLLLVGILAGGLWLRLRHVTTEGIQIDESYQSLVAEGFRERGFPSRVLEPRQPVVYISTSELVHFVVGLSSLFVETDKGFNRGPAVVWGTLTVLLLYLTGRRMFSREVGLLAATLGALAPYCIHMSNWGRYPAQLHFLTLATVYCMWRTIDGRGPVSRRWLWLTAISFVAMYFSWEGSGFVAIGLVLAVLVKRRGTLRAILMDPSVWLAMLAALLALIVQYSHREIQQSHRMYFGYGDTKLTVAPMWMYPSFDVLGFMWKTGWSQSMVMPVFGFLGGLALCVRHRFREAARFVTMIFSATCIAMSLLMPLTIPRYIFHMVPLLILISAAALAGCAQAVACRSLAQQKKLSCYVHCVVAASVMAILIAANGLTFDWIATPHRQSSGPPVQESQAPRPANALWMANFTGPMQYVCDHWQDGDIILTDLPMFTGHLLKEIRGNSINPNDVTLWVESCQKREASLSDEWLVPVHRMEGTTMVSSREALHSVFAHKGRI